MKKLNLLVVILITMFAFSGTVYAVCPLGPDVTEDLHGLLKIFNYAAPLILIVFSIIDVLKTITKGDAVGNVKSVRDRFLKRLLYTVILFFIPILVDQFMIMAGVWDSEGGCDLYNPVENGQDGTPGGGDGSGTTRTTTTVGSCESLNSTNCSLGLNCTMQDGRCVKVCYAYGASSCPSDRCQVGNNGLCVPKNSTPTSTTTRVTGDGCNTLGRDSCASGPNCTIYNGNCVKVCGVYSPGTCPSSRCKVVNNQCVNK